jgi:hypothetical protein
MFGGGSNAFWHPHSFAQGSQLQDMANATMQAFAGANRMAADAAQQQRAFADEAAKRSHAAQQADAQRQHEKAMAQMASQDKAARNQRLAQMAGLGGHTITSDGKGWLRHSLLG